MKRFIAILLCFIVLVESIIFANPINVEAADGDTARVVGRSVTIGRDINRYTLGREDGDGEVCVFGGTNDANYGVGVWQRDTSRENITTAEIDYTQNANEAIWDTLHGIDGETWIGLKDSADGFELNAATVGYVYIKKDVNGDNRLYSELAYIYEDFVGFDFFDWFKNKPTITHVYYTKTVDECNVYIPDIADVESYTWRQCLSNAVSDVENGGTALVNDFMLLMYDTYYTYNEDDIRKAVKRSADKDIAFKLTGMSEDTGSTTQGNDLYLVIKRNGEVSIKFNSESENVCTLRTATAGIDDNPLEVVSKDLSDNWIYNYNGTGVLLGPVANSIRNITKAYDAAVQELRDENMTYAAINSARKIFANWSSDISDFDRYKAVWAVEFRMVELLNSNSLEATRAAIIREAYAELQRCVRGTEYSPNVFLNKMIQGPDSSNIDEWLDNLSLIAMLRMYDRKSGGQYVLPGDSKATKLTDPMNAIVAISSRHETASEEGTKFYDIISLNRRGKNVATVEEEYKSLCSSIPQTQIYTQESANILNVAGYFDRLVVYLNAKIYGKIDCGSDPYSESGFVQNVATLSDVKMLSEMANDLVRIVDVYPDAIPEFSNLAQITGDERSLAAFTDLCIAYVIADSYANSINSGLTIDTSDGDIKYVNTTFESADFKARLEFCNSLDQLNSNEKTWAVTYKAISSGLTKLGIRQSDCTEALSTVMEYAKLFDGLVVTTDILDTEQDLNEPLHALFNIGTGQLSADYRTGVALSASYIPMKTNVYDPTSVSIVDDYSFITDFHYPFAFYRKALYICTDVDAATSLYVKGLTLSNRKVATLRDLLAADKDIVLYIDDNFYNAGYIADLLSLSYDKVSQGEAVTAGELWDSVWKHDVASILKTGTVTEYNDNLYASSTDYSPVELVVEETETEYILNNRAIDKYLRVASTSEDSETVAEMIYNEYTPLQSFAVTSAIYRHSGLYRVIKQVTNNIKPVFVSSPNLAFVPGASYEEYGSYINYVMLMNLSESLGIDNETIADLDLPVYMDVYGNILTESGLVVIPAMSNATLIDPAGYTVYTAGFVSLYKNGWHIPLDVELKESYLTQFFEKDEEKGTWELRNIAVYGYFINFKHLSSADPDVLSTIVQLANVATNRGYLNFNQHVYLITEVLRGAPIDRIDKEYEGLVNTNVTKTGLYVGNVLEQLVKALKSSNTGNNLLTLPNIAYIQGVEYVMLFVFKYMFVLMFLMLIYRLYVDAVAGMFGIRTFAHILFAIVGTVTVIYIVPVFMNVSYDKMNELLLRDEMMQIVTLNYEKDSVGSEISLSRVTKPETMSEIYLKIDEVNVPWYEILPSILLSSVTDKMSDLYDETFQSHLMYGLDGVERKSNGLYVNVNTILNSSRIKYDSSDLLMNVVLEEPYVSYCMPYYIILDQLVTRVNKYNQDNNIKDYTVKVQAQGAVRTYGLVTDFFKSNYFMAESQDVLGLFDAYGIETSLVEKSGLIDSDGDMDYTQSIWYASNLTDEAIELKLNELNTYARKYVIENSDLLSVVSDECFLKTFALAMSVKYNKLFNVPSCDSLQLYAVDTTDLLRCVLADKTTVMRGSSKSFARFVLEEYGTFGVILAAVLVVILYVASFVRPVVLLLMCGQMLVAVALRRTIRRDSDSAMTGLIITTALICVLNTLYSVTLKLSIVIANTELSWLVAAWLQIALQIVNLALLWSVLLFVWKDWKNLGTEAYQNVLRNLSVMVKTGVNNEYHSVIGGSRSFSQRKIRRSTRGVTGHTIYERMKLRDYKNKV